MAANKAVGTHECLQPLASRLLEVSRQGAIEINQEKSRLIQKTLNLIAESAVSEEKGGQTGEHGVSRALVDNLEVGYLLGQTSAVPSSEENDALNKYDLEHGFVDKSTASYLPFVNLILPENDSDLTFTLSPLPSVNNARLVNQNGFTPLAKLYKNGEQLKVGCCEFSSAVRITVRTNIKLCRDFESRVVASSSAVTNGTASNP